MLERNFGIEGGLGQVFLIKWPGFAFQVQRTASGRIGQKRKWHGGGV